MRMNIRPSHFAALALASALAFSACSSQPSIPHTAAPDLPSRPCPTEDAQGPCFWDAGNRGDGHGASFWVDDTGNIYFLDPQIAASRRH